MPRLVAFLRGINVGGHRVKMDELRRHFEALGFREVETFIASGNVIFETRLNDIAKVERQIETHLAKMLGYAVPTIIRTLPELGAVASHQPFSPADMADVTNSLNVLFLRAAPGKEVERALAALDGAKDAFRVHRREMYWLCRGKISIDSLAAPFLGKALTGAEGTLRNLRTVRQLAEKYPDSP